MAGVACDKYGFFNGIYALEQSNWADFFKGLIPDCVISNRNGAWSSMGGEFEVYAPTGGAGMSVKVRSGQAFVNGHHIWSTSEKDIAIPTAHSTYDRNDSIILRVTYGNAGASTAEIDVLKGAEDGTGDLATLTQNTGTIYEYLLAVVLVDHGQLNILPEKVTDKRYIYCGASDDSTVTDFSTATITPQNGMEHRNGTAQDSMTINLPEHPYPTFITSIRFPSSSSFSGTVINQGYTAIYDIANSINNIKLKGDSLNLKSKLYQLVIWYDGEFYWVASAGV